MNIHMENWVAYKSQASCFLIWKPLYPKNEWMNEWMNENIHRQQWPTRIANLKIYTYNSNIDLDIKHLSLVCVWVFVCIYRRCRTLFLHSHSTFSSTSSSSRSLTRKHTLLSWHNLNIYTLYYKKRLYQIQFALEKRMN